MANNGLKSFTKQLTNSFGILDYAVNLCKQNKNLIFSLNLLSY